MVVVQLWEVEVRLHEVLAGVEEEQVAEEEVQDARLVLEHDELELEQRDDRVH